MAALLVGAAEATVMDSHTFTGVLHGPGTTPGSGVMMSHSFGATGYTLGRIDFTAAITELAEGGNDFASENRARVTHPNGSFTTVQYTTTTSYSGTINVSGSFYLGYGTSPPWSGPWNFSFFNTFDDSTVGNPDASVDITFNLTDVLDAPAAPAATDFGVIMDTSAVYTTPDHMMSHTGGAVRWYKLTINESALANTKFLDIDTEGSGAIDTEIGLYNATGGLVSSDDDDGSGTLSQLTFGLTSPTRPIGTSVGGNGRDGELSMGVYYLAVAGFNATFNPGFSVTTTSTNTTTPVNVNIRTSIPEPASLILAALGGLFAARRRR
jgi:hypothetical protein